MVNDKHISVYIAGDSTVQTYNDSDSQQAGWGQFISKYFTKDIKFINCSIAGRSSKSFINEGRLEDILNTIEKGDYLFIQMGHNDAAVDKPERYTEPTVDYKKYLKMYVDGAKKIGAIPILITPVATLKYSGKGFINEFPEYCISMKELALQENIKCIDLMSKSLNYFSEIGYDECYSMFMVSLNKTDYAHFNKKGADIIAEIVAKELEKLDKSFKAHENK